MTGLLISVADVAEARVALDAGVDILDMKNPAAGALGRLPLKTIKEIAVMARGIVTTSATIGDLPMDAGLLAAATAEVMATGVDIVKIGFFGHETHTECAHAVAESSQGKVGLVAVMMADDHPNFAFIPTLKAAGFSGVMLDTASKHGKSLLDYLRYEDLSQFCRIAKSCGLLAGLAGSLQEAHIAMLSGLTPDYLGFRGAVCESENRRAVLDKVRLLSLQFALHKYNKLPLEAPVL